MTYLRRLWAALWGKPLPNDPKAKPAGGGGHGEEP
jgi:hypothetical protein